MDNKETESAALLLCGGVCVYQRLQKVNSALKVKCLLELPAA